LASLEDSRPATIALALVLSYLGVGVGFYSQATEWSLGDSIYFVAITLSSVGYGDLTPQDDVVKLFTCGYILVGVGVVGTALGEVLSSLLDAPASKVEGSTPEAQRVSGGGGTSLFTSGGGGDATGALLTTSAIVVATIGAGSAALLQLEPGLRLVDAIYSSVVTVTTVGYGDFTPTTEAGRIFVTGYALFGTILLARSLGALAALPLERRRRRLQQIVLEQYGENLEDGEFADLQRITRELGLCTPERGYCTAGDFALAMLVRQDKCTVPDVKRALDTFSKLDADSSGMLDADDVALAGARASGVLGEGSRRERRDAD
jgi:potassium channel subfamily K